MRVLRYSRDHKFSSIEINWLQNRKLYQHVSNIPSLNRRLLIMREIEIVRKKFPTFRKQIEHNFHGFEILSTCVSLFIVNFVEQSQYEKSDDSREKDI